MPFPLKPCPQPSFLARLLQTAALSLVFMTASAVGARAEDVTVTDTEVGATGALGYGDGYGDIPAGPGGPASAFAAASSATGNATATATAIGGQGGTSIGENDDSPGGDAFATSTATTTGFGDATSTANATGGGTGYGGGGGFATGGNAEAMADASATGGGKAIATAVATQGAPAIATSQVYPAIATSNAETVNGAMADARSAVDGTDIDVGEAKSSAKTSLGGVSVRSTVMALSTFTTFPPLTTTEAVVQGDSIFSVAQAFAFSTVLPDKPYATMLTDTYGGASNVADTLLGPQDKIFGTAFQFGDGTMSTTFDFSFRGDLILGVIYSYDFDVIINGAQVFAGADFTDHVLDLGSGFGPNIELTIEGSGVFAFGGAVPEPSTWAMMLIGFAGLGFAGYRSAGRTRGLVAARHPLFAGIRFTTS